MCEAVIQDNWVIQGVGCSRRVALLALCPDISYQNSPVIIAVREGILTVVPDVIREAGFSDFFFTFSCLLWNVEMVKCGTVLMSGPYFLKHYFASLCAMFPHLAPLE